MGVYLGKIPVGIIIKAKQSAGYLRFCNIKQIINRDACELIITESDVATDYVIGWTEDGEYVSLYVCER